MRSVLKGTELLDNSKSCLCGPTDGTAPKIDLDFRAERATGPNTKLHQTLHERPSRLHYVALAQVDVAFKWIRLHRSLSCRGDKGRRWDKGTYRYSVAALAGALAVP